MKMKHWLWIFFGILAFFVLLVGLFAGVGYFAMKSASHVYTQGDIALVHVEGVITSGKTAPMFMGGSGAGSETLLRVLDRVGSNPHFKAIVLRVNSPGGTAAGSQEIYEKLGQIRARTGKRIVVSMGDVAASGAYYISSNADKIVAEPSTLTGSIGVIAQLMNLEGLFKKIGAHPETLKAGRLKDLGNQSRPLTPEEKKIFQDILDETHQDFISDVAKGRKLPVDYVRKLADGRIYTGRQALGLHLVDSLGNLEDAEGEAARLVGIIGSYKVVDVDRRSVLEQLVGESGASESLSEWRMVRHALNDFSLQGLLFLADERFSPSN